MIRHKSGVLRIVGGQWRRRLLPVPNVSGLRPTLDRIRETVFNWLLYDIKGATCLDLFAGSGALGFEALSRGAKHVSFVDSNRQVIQHLKGVAETLKVPEEQIEIIEGRVPNDPLSLSFAPYDIVFLDPPYHCDRLPEFARWIEHNAYLMESGLIYMEMEKSAVQFSFPGWQLLQEATTSSIYYCLFQRKRCDSAQEKNDNLCLG